jgi:signal transduction histidine kinase
MSHELRTPLNAIIGFSDIISAERFGRIESRKYVEYATDIRSAGDHLLELINEILDFSKIENGNTVLDEQTIDVCGLIERCMRLIKPQAEAKHIRLVASGIEEIIALKCDELRMRQVLINILSNAVKFTLSQGSVSVRVFSSGKHFCIEVRDTGIGMTSDEIKAAIQPFVQIHSTTFQKTEGTGLGLPIAKKLVELHGGDLKISSRPGSGTIITIEMPPWRLET